MAHVVEQGIEADAGELNVGLKLLPRFLSTLGRDFGPRVKTSAVALSRSVRHADFARPCSAVHLGASIGEPDARHPELLPGDIQVEARRGVPRLVLIGGI